MIYRKVIIFLLFSTTIGTLYAQEEPFNNYKLNLEFGLTRTRDISYDEDYNDERALLSPNIGLIYSINLQSIHWISTGIGYYRIGDIYDYFTGRNRNKTDVVIYANTLRIPVLYSIEFDKGQTTNFFMRAGPSFNLIIGKPTINPNDELNNPDGFRNNVTQGSVQTNFFPLLSLSAGFNFKTNPKNDINYLYLEFFYSSTAQGIFRESTSSRTQSNYRIMGLKFGIWLIGKK